MEWRHSEDTFKVLKELAKTLGYCSGFQGRNLEDDFSERFGEIPMEDSERAELHFFFAESFVEGMADLQAGEEDTSFLDNPEYFVSIPVQEIHPGNPFS